MTDRIIKEADARIVRGSVVLHELITKAYNLSKVTLAVQNPIQVLSGGRMVGFAFVWHTGDKIMADLRFGFDTPERLTLENDEDVYVESDSSFGFELSDGSETVELAVSMGMLQALAFGQALALNKLYIRSISLTTVRVAGQSPLVVTEGF